MGDMYLIHHGIKGQKWGVRNGPPYPLGEQHKSSAERTRFDSKKAAKVFAIATSVSAVGASAIKESEKAK